MSHDQDSSDIDGVSSPKPPLQVETGSSPKPPLQVETGIGHKELILPGSIPQSLIGNPDRHWCY